MDQIVSFFVGDIACDAGLSYLYLEANQMFDEDDPVKHDVLFYPSKDDIKPRALFFGDNLEIQTRINHTKIVSKKDEESKEEIIVETQEQVLVNYYLNKIDIKTNQYHKVPKSQDNQTFCSKYSLQQREEIDDKITTQLEQQNRCDGFQVLIDTSVYSSLGHLILESLKEQSPKTPILCSSLHQDVEINKIQQEISNLNRILSLINYSESANMFIPLTIPFKNFNFFTRQQQNFNSYQQFALLYSSITLNYRVKDDQLGFENYVQRMTPFAGCNIFNLMARIPLQQDNENDHILNHKQDLHQNPYLKSNYMDRIVRYEQTYRSYAESYSLRGLTSFPKEIELKTIGIDIRIIDDIYNIPQKFEPQLFTKQIYDNYGQIKEFNENIEESNSNNDIRINALPLHTCIFSNECYKYNLRNLQNQIGQLNHKTFLQFEKDDFGKDDLHDLYQKYEYKIESYGGLYENDSSEQSDSD